jgi:digeranylgeranylglycerophospholipid reductase
VSKIYDVIIAGGSISGLLAARELSSHNGISVLVLEEDYEVGTPEHCGGLVSMSAVEKLQTLPSAKSIQNKVKRQKSYLLPTVLMLTQIIKKSLY